MGRDYVLVSDFQDNSLKYAPFGSWDEFKEIPGLVNVTNPTFIRYDPVGQHIYWVAYDATGTRQQINRCALEFYNGTQEEAIVTHLYPENSSKCFFFFSQQNLQIGLDKTFINLIA